MSADLSLNHAILQLYNLVIQYGLPFLQTLFLFMVLHLLFMSVLLVCVSINWFNAFYLLYGRGKNSLLNVKLDKVCIQKNLNGFLIYMDRLLIHLLFQSIAS